MRVAREQSVLLRLSAADLGESSGLGADRVARLMRGEIWMRLEDAAALGEAVGVVLIAAASFAGQGMDTAWWPASPGRACVAHRSPTADE